jgi:hypothetical protein
LNRVRKPQVSSKRTPESPIQYPDYKDVKGINSISFLEGLKWISQKPGLGLIPEPQILALPFVLKIEPYQKLAAQKWRFNFNIVKGQNGETYHGLIGALITSTFLGSEAGLTMAKTMQESHDLFEKTQKSNEKFKGKIQPMRIPYPTVFHLTASSSNQRSLLHYYLHRSQLEKPRCLDWPDRLIKDDLVISRPELTHQIAEFFRYNSRSEQQEAIHRAIVSLLDDQSIADSMDHFKYMMPSYLAKFFVNRYLYATWKHKLPKACDVGRVAFIFVRRGATAGDPRQMDRVNLPRCLDAIRRANDIARIQSIGSVTSVGTPAQRFTHVIIYGEVGVKEVVKLMDEEKYGFKTIGLAAPFDSDLDNERGNEVWSSFKYQNLEWYAPQEVMWVGIFMALKARYGPYISCIGFKSGNLDVPGLLGLPIFSLDNQVAEDARSAYYNYEEAALLLSRAPKDGGPLPSKLPMPERMVQSLKSERDNKGTSTGPPSEETPVISTGIPESQKKKPKSNKGKERPDRSLPRFQGKLSKTDAEEIGTAAFKKGNQTWEECFQGGEYLWDKDSYGAGGFNDKMEHNYKMERMEEMSRRLNTFITINLPLIYGIRDTSGGNVARATRADQVVRLTRPSQDHLSAALAVWALQDVAGAPRWRRRVQLMESLTEADKLRVLFEGAAKIASALE